MFLCHTYYYSSIHIVVLINLDLYYSSRKLKYSKTMFNYEVSIRRQRKTGSFQNNLQS